MSNLTLVTGGARSGKSTHAETLAKCLGNNILYIATGIAFDDEMKSRVKKHKERRPTNWDTLEAYKNFKDRLPLALSNVDGVLLDCVTILTTNIMMDNFDENSDTPTEMIDNLEQNVISELKSIVEILKENNIPGILVTNEIGMGIVPANFLSRSFRDIAGRANQLLGSICDNVYLCVSGIPMKIK